MPAVLITGSNRGIGLEFTRQYAEDGWQVIATCRAPEKAEALRQLAKKHPSVRIEKLDVAGRKSLAALSGKLQDVPLDLLINNAGILSGTELQPDAVQSDKSQLFGTIDPAAWAKAMHTNAIAPVMVTQTFLPNLRRAANGKVIMISSEMGSIEHTYPGHIAYCTSKAALNMGMRNAALTLRNEKIVVVSLHPGWVKTDMGGRSAPLTPEESVKGMRKVIAGLTLKQSGQFFQYDGEKLAW
ncbi:MAG: SDR family oxidoreductase [Alphaproteobacteria bacterium]|nr:SDR family oxidoreductase [Alphaproteobacteria bacterium]